ncbi:MAG: phosphoribosylamine--glycine ligase [Hyphomonas sp.]|nr:phosphoribosylamine--glycine ligase [Hyphomonas sp.]
MNILLLGSGGREHALAWKLAQSPSLTKLYAAPGNPGIAEEAEIVALNATDHAAVIAFCEAQDIGLVVIGPEAPLVDGLSDSLRAAGVPVFGPSQAAAQLEGSKGFTKDLCARAGIPTAGYVRTASLEEARAALARFSAPYVLKADGLAAGKGVVIAATLEEAEETLADMFGGGFGGAGAQVVIEEFMAGEEASFFALTDGTAIVPFGSAQDHKRVGDGDTGPNTGGMGAYSPAPVLTPELQARVMAEIIEPTVRTMRAEGNPYQGVLFAGLMLTAEGPKLIEYNARFGDPECQVLMMRLQSDLVALMLACAQGTLEGVEVALADKTNGGAKVFHAGTALLDGALVANGGRVLNVTATGTSVTEAQAKAYAAVDAVSFPTGFCRRDIGWREVTREAAR